MTSLAARASTLFLGMAIAVIVSCTATEIPNTAATDSAFAHAESTYWRGAHDSARAEYGALMAAAEARKDSATLGRALTRLAIVEWRESEYTAASELATRALGMRLRPEDAFYPYNTLGLIAYSQGRSAEAVPLFDNAIAAARRLGDSLNVAKAVMNRGLAATELGDFEGGRENFVSARVTARSAGDTRLEGKCLANLAMLEIKAGDPLTAIALLDTARAIYRRSDYAAGEQNALGQLGVALAAIGEPQRALATLDSALAQSRQQELPQEEASNLQLIGEQYRDAGDYHRALDYLSQAQTLNAKLGLEDERGTALRDAADVYLALGQMTLARRQAREALAVHLRSESLLEQLVDFLLLARIHERDNRRAAMDSALHAASDIAARLGTRDARARVALATADMLDRDGDPRSVLAVLDSARDLASSSANEGNLLALRARAHRRLGHLDSAAAIGYRAVRAVERIRGRYGSGTLRASYAWDHASAYTDLVFVLLQLRRLDDAFGVADAARGRALLEHLAEARNSALRSVGAARELLQGERLLQQIDELTRKLRDRPASLPSERSVADRDETELAAQLARTRSDYEALLERATVRDASGSALLGVNRVDAAAVRSALRADETLLEYFVTVDGLVIFAVTADSVRVIRVDTKANELGSRVRVARELLGRREPHPVATATAVLGTLYEALITPVRRAGALDRARRLIIVPHGVLTYLPFAALRDPRTGRFLVQDLTPLYGPSAAAFVLARTSPQVTRSPESTVALAPFPEDLPAADVEARRVATIAPHGSVVRGADASEARLRQALETASLVHVASHAELNAQNPMFSHVALRMGASGDRADDGRLEVHELLGIRIRSTLVFLSGCETGVGAAWSTSFRQGEDYTTLAQAFLYAGARTVVASLWRIEDDAAAEFAGHFYEALRQSDAAEALAIAQRTMIRLERFATPYDWAAYQITGDAARLTATASAH